jgi:hypothetical protein
MDRCTDELLRVIAWHVARASPVSFRALCCVNRELFLLLCPLAPALTMDVCVRFSPFFFGRRLPSAAFVTVCIA